MMRNAAFSIAVVLQAGAAVAAPQIKAPSCEALAAWSTGVNQADLYNVSPVLKLPKAFEDARLVPVFGTPALAWTAEDVQLASQSMVACYAEAGKRRDKVAAAALVNGNRAMLGNLAKVNAALQKAKADLQPIVQEIDAAANSAELDRALGTLLEGNPAAPDPNALRGPSQEVNGLIWRLARVLPNLADAEREPLYKALGERRVAIQASQREEADKEIAAAPADASGVLALMALQGRVAGFADPAAKASSSAKAGERLEQIRGGLRQAKPAVWTPPDCLDLYRWAAAPDARRGVALGDQGSVMGALADDKVISVFGLTLADWTEEDLGHFKTLRTLCQAQASTLAAAGERSAELVQLAQQGRWIEGAEPQLASARALIAQHQKAQAALEEALAKIKEVPDAADALPQLNQVASAALTQAQPPFGPQARSRIGEALNAKRATISARVADDAVKDLAAMKAETLTDLGKLWTHGMQAGRTIPDQRAQQAFYAALERTLGEAAGKLLPQFQAKVAALPATLQGIGGAHVAVGELTGIGDGAEKLPFLKGYNDVAATRREAIKGAVREEACAGLVSSLGVGGDAKEPIWDGDQGMPLGAFLCALAQRGVGVHAWSGPGMFSKTATLKVTPVASPLVTYSLRKGEVQPGKTMLLGFQRADANVEQLISVPEWEAFGQVTKAPVEFAMMLPTAGCGRFENTPPEKVNPGDKPFWLECLFEAGGLDGTRR